LAGANLSGASLQGAIGVTAKTLEQQTENLGLTIMPDGSVHAGHYVTGEFIGDEGLGPTLSFNVGKGWERDPRVLPMNGELFLNGPEGGQLIFMTPLHVFDTSNLSKPQKVDAPEDADKWVTWFHKHPRLETSKPFRVRIGDASGRGIDVTAPPDLCPYGRPCIPLYYGPTQIAIWSGWKDRIVIVDVEGRRVVIDISAPADKFDEFLPEAQKVLDTVEW
jgi:hypothetical protein